MKAIDRKWRLASEMLMDGLIKSLPAILKAAGDSDQVSEAACMAAWKHAAGEGLRNHAVAVRRSQKILVVAVADATWQKQLHSLGGQLLFRLNSILGQPLVTFIDFRVDPRALSEARAGQIANQADGPLSNPKSVAVELVAAAAGIQDRKLRRAFLGAATSCLNRLERSRALLRSDISSLKAET